MANFNSEHKAVLDELLLPNPLVRAGKMFGYPAYYAGRKLFASLYEGGVGVKLPETTAPKLIAEDPHVVPFQPLGRPKMREWVQIDLDNSADYRAYLAVFEESIRFLLNQQGLVSN